MTLLPSAVAGVALVVAVYWMAGEFVERGVALWFWRDMGYALGALIAGAVADALGYGGASAIVAGLTAASGVWVLADMPTGRHRHLPIPEPLEAASRQPDVHKATSRGAASRKRS